MMFAYWATHLTGCTTVSDARVAKVVPLTAILFGLPLL